MCGSSKLRNNPVLCNPAKSFCVRIIMETHRRIAYYTTLNSDFLVTVPKRRGKGYLKSCFGWSYHNAQSLQWLDEHPTEYATGDVCDIDGYLSLQMVHDISQDEHELGIVAIVDVLKRIFPHVDEWVEDAEMFWESVR